MINSVKSKYSLFLDKKSKIKNSIFGNFDYKKFVIVSDSRTGSTLLMNFLNSHPEIIAKGEIFKSLNGASCKYIWDNFFVKYPKEIKYVGFKLFYHHPWDDDKKVWNLMNADKDIVIIHLTRENLLRSLVSKKIGLKTKQWTENIERRNGISLEEKKTTLSIQECIEYFEKIHEYQDKTEDRFSQHKIIRIVYEELAESYQNVMSKVFSKLSLSNHNVEVTMRKQNPEDLNLLIENYNELKSYFKSTKWQSYFNEKSI